MEQVWLCGKDIIKKMKGLNNVLKKLGVKIKRKTPAQHGQEDMVLIECSSDTLLALRVFSKIKLHG